MTNGPNSGGDKGIAATAAVTASAAAILATVYVAQYGFDLWPCSLCYMQRVPYVAVVVLGGLSLMPAVDARSRRVVLFHLVGLFALAAALGLYHVGVEMGWWLGPAACTGGARTFSIQDLGASLAQPGGPTCEEPAFVFMGISLAGYNMIAGLALAAISLAAALRKAWWAKA
jgi:disulfide bond formation protein DsbB